MSSYSTYPGPRYSANPSNQPRGFASPITVGSYNPLAHAVKREAEAVHEAEADPIIGRQGLYQTVFNTAYNPALHVVPAVPADNNAKREAEAEADPIIGHQGLYQTNFSNYPIGYTTTSLRRYTAPVRSYPYWSVYSGYRNFIQPARQYFIGYYY